MHPDRPLVAVLLGTDHHRFDRLVRWTEQLAAAGEIDWFVQHGATPMRPHHPWMEGRSILGAADLEDLLRRADAVVTHGGPGLIMEARTHGHLPVVVARDPVRGEHVDDHQQRFVRRISGSGSVVEASTPLELADAVRRAIEQRATGAPGAGAPAGHRQHADDDPTASERFGRLVDLLVARSRAARG
jgi:UDP-N-acetylglucosamine transferase subunit ALG13